MWWSMIISVIILIAASMIMYPPDESYARLFREAPMEYRIALSVCLFVISAVMLVRFIFFIFLRKKNNAKIANIKSTGIRVTGKVENIIEKGISVKYKLAVSYTAPNSAERRTVCSPLLNKDPRHYTDVGKDIPVYVSANNDHNIYIDITD